MIIDFDCSTDEKREVSSLHRSTQWREETKRTLIYKLDCSHESFSTNIILPYRWKKNDTGIYEKQQRDTDEYEEEENGETLICILLYAVIRQKNASVIKQLMNWRKSSLVSDYWFCHNNAKSLSKNWWIWRDHFDNLAM